MPEEAGTDRCGGGQGSLHRCWRYQLGQIIGRINLLLVGKKPVIKVLVVQETKSETACSHTVLKALNALILVRIQHDST